MRGRTLAGKGWSVCRQERCVLGGAMSQPARCLTPWLQGLPGSSRRACFACHIISLALIPKSATPKLRRQHSYGMTPAAHPVHKRSMLAHSHTAGRQDGGLQL